MLRPGVTEILCKPVLGRRLPPKLLHDPPRFGIAGELYAQAFYDQLARMLRRGVRMFHYTGSPNRLSSGRDVPRDVAKRLGQAGFKAQLAFDGVLAIRR